MKITKSLLENWQACPEGLVWFESQTEKDAVKLVKTLLRKRNLDWANWLIARCLTRINGIKYAVYAAESCLQNFEKLYPEDKRPRRTIEAAKAVLENDTPETRHEALRVGGNARPNVTDNSAWYAAHSARSAADSAASAKDSRFAASGSWSAAFSAGSAFSAAYVEAFSKIIRFGITLFKEQGDNCENRRSLKKRGT